jgi:hypothetical protein
MSDNQRHLWEGGTCIYPVHSLVVVSVDHDSGDSSQEFTQRQSGKVQATKNRKLCVDGVVVCTRGGGYPWFPFLRLTHEVDPNPRLIMLSEHTGVSHSRDVSRQSSNSDISTTQQGWHDDLMSAMAAEGPTQTRRTVTHITPFRDRIKSITANSRRKHDFGGTLTPPTVIASTNSSIFDHSQVRSDRRRISAEQPKSASSEKDQEYMSPAGKRTWGEAIYKVGYEREVLDT